MERWSFSAELLAFILISMVVLFYFDRMPVKSLRRRLFEASLWMSAGSIILNAVCVYGIENVGSFPYWLNMLLNSTYFMLNVAMCMVVAVYMFDLLLEHVYSKHCRVNAAVGSGILTTAYLLLVLTNYWTKLLFWFDSAGVYHRGKWNQAGYVVALMELVLVGICYCRNRASVEQRVKRVMYTLPPVVLLLVIFQLLYPEILLNGTIVTFVLLVIFINFNTIQMERDGLTKLGNRRNFYEELALRLNGKQHFQVVTVAINDFAKVNQQLGYRKGDEVLYHIAHWLDTCTSEGRAFRIGNVTFAVVCSYVNEEKSDRLLQAMEERFKKPWQLGEVECTVSASFGSTICRELDFDATQMVEMICFMVELAKNSEEEKIEFGPDVVELFRKEKHLEQLLKNAIENRNFEVWYQPVFNCKTHRFDSCEALLRMRDDDGKLISPLDFIPLAEKNGMIEEIGWFVWCETCRFMARHPEFGLKSTSVNMSVQQFMNPTLCDRMEEYLKANHLSADKVKLEITERVIMQDERYVNRAMHQFADKGFIFCVDDFGVGYSNFSGVMHLPFEVVKLDRSLVEKISTNRRDRMIVQSMMDLFHNMGLKVVAEGIETSEQQKLLESMGAEYIQGFYYAKPMPESELTAFLGKAAAMEAKIS